MLACNHSCDGERATYHVLRETLRHTRLMALLDEVAQSKCISISVAARKALVGHVKEREVSALLYSVGDSLPLILRGVHSRRVVRAGMQQHDAIVWDFGEVLEHAIEIEADGLWVVVSVGLDLEARVLEHHPMIRPAWSWDIGGLRVRIEAFEECAADAESAGAGDGLRDGDAVFLQWLGGWAVGKESSSLRETWDAGDAWVFLVQSRINDLLLRLPH